MTPVLFLVIPCYNEEEVLPETGRRLNEKYDALIASGAISPETLEARWNGSPAGPDAEASGADGKEEREGPAGEAARFCHSR